MRPLVVGVLAGALAVALWIGSVAVALPSRGVETALPSSLLHGTWYATASAVEVADRPHPATPAPPPPATTYKRPQCPTRYLYFANKDGRHSNQLRALIHALHFGAAMNRTVIVPPFRQDQKWYPLSALYDSEGLISVFCMKEEEDVPFRVQPRVGCIERKGIASKIPRSPSGWKVECHKRVVLRGAERSVLDMVRAAEQLGDVDVVYLFEALYYKNLSPACFWRSARPSTPIASEVTRVLDALPKPTAAIHLRGLEKSCRDRLRKMAVKANVQIDGEGYTQCDPSVEYVKGALDRTGAKGVYLADDGQRPAITAALRRELGAVRYADVGAGRYPPATLPGMLVDFWVLVRADVLLANQASSLSTNARNARIFRHHDILPGSYGTYNWLAIPQHADPEDLSLCRSS
eukprot:Sspe_Gene.83535::Locus_54797_Transcript_2_3_Confidence_0.400_Length_1315::g.83535::m.83535